MKFLTTVGVACLQGQADADFLICNSAIEALDGCDRPVILVEKDTDLLVMLLARACQTLIYSMQEMPFIAKIPLSRHYTQTPGTICLQLMQSQGATLHQHCSKWVKRRH